MTDGYWNKLHLKINRNTKQIVTKLHINVYTHNNQMCITFIILYKLKPTQQTITVIIVVILNECMLKTKNESEFFFTNILYGIQGWTSLLMWYLWTLKSY